MTDAVLMYDSDVAADIPLGAPIVAGYVDGEPGTWSAEDWDRFPTSQKIAIVRKYIDAGDAYDIEDEAGTIAEAPGWNTAAQKRGVARPWHYIDLDQWQELHDFLNAKLGPGTARGYWVAHWTGEPHELALPDGTKADAVQYASPSTGSGGHFDKSEVYGLLPWESEPAPTEPTPGPAPAPSGGIEVQVTQLQNGSSGPEVKAAQAILNGKAHAGLTVDGAFGPRTEEAVKAWQQFFRLEVDGIVGAATWPTLIGG